MPKIAQIPLSKVNAYVAEFPEEFKKTPKNEIYCFLCECVVKHEKRFFVTSHLPGARNFELKLNPPIATQQFLPTASGTDFAKEVVRVFLAADIPLKKLGNTDLRNLFSEMGHPLPNESSAREKLKTLAIEETARVKGILSEKQIFAVVDESDIRGTKFLVILASSDTRWSTQKQDRLF